MGDYRSDQNAGIILNGDGCSSMKSCTLPFRGNHESFYAIAVPPGNYQIDSFVLNAGGFQTKYVTFSDKIKTTLK
ncbi:MAG: hypothetical protein H3C43_14075, partial [Leptonema sp. (in: Bacteria)]|nr:hypothetical protein [Leptonema sp. (in: bacteria)]